MNNPELKELILRWYKNSSKDEILINDSFDKFICLWIGFNAWGRYKTDNNNNDRQMINSLKSYDNLIEAFSEAKNSIDEFTTTLNEFSGVEIPTHKQNPKYVSFNNDDEFGNILECIYIIRCNLFHGRKDPSFLEEQRLVVWATYVLRHIFEKLMSREDFM